MRTAANEPGRGGERGNRPDRGGHAERVGGDPGKDRADGEAPVAPEPVDADRSRPPGRVCDVADRGQERWVDHRGADAEQDGTKSPCREAGGRGDQPDRNCLREHPGDDEEFAANAIGESTGHELAEAPDRGVDGREHADTCDGESRGGEVQREDAPGEAVVEVVDEAGLAARRQRWLSKTGQCEDLTGGESLSERAIG